MMRSETVRRSLSGFAWKEPDEQRAELEALRAAFEKHGYRLTAEGREYWEATLELMEAITNLEGPLRRFVGWWMARRGFIEG